MSENNVVIRNMLGVVDDGKRIYQVDTSQVSAEEYDYCQTLYNVLWGEKGLVESLGPTWHLVHDPRFILIEKLFCQDRPAIFGGDARLGKQYIDGASIMSHSMAELEAYSEILGEGRHFLDVIKAQGLSAGEIKNKDKEYLWALIRQECPNYFDNKDGLPNRRAQTLFYLLKEDLVGLISDYSELAYLREWIRLDTGEAATEEDMANSHENPVVWAEVDYLERALTTRASLRVTAVKILQRSGLLKMLESDPKYKLTDAEIDKVLQIIYQLPYEQIDQAPLKVLTYLRALNAIPVEERLSKECAMYSAKSQRRIEELRLGVIEPISTSKQEDIKRELTDEEKLVLALQKEPNRLELFSILVEAEQVNDFTTIDLIKPVLENTTVEVTDEILMQLKSKTRNSRTSSAVKDLLP